MGRCHCHRHRRPHRPHRLQINWRLSDEPTPPAVDDVVDERLLDAAFRGATRCKIFLGYTSNLVSAGVREHIRYLVQVRCAVWVCVVR